MNQIWAALAALGTVAAALQQAVKGYLGWKSRKDRKEEREAVEEETKTIKDEIKDEKIDELNERWDWPDDR